MIDLLLTADAAWLGGTTLAGRIAVGVHAGTISWLGPIAGAPPAARHMHIDGVLLPGFTDHHVHTLLIDPRRLLAAGVTTLIDLGWIPAEIWPLVTRSQDDQRLPHIKAAGPFLTAPGGYPTKQEWAPTGVAVEINDPHSAVRAVESLLPNRPTTIKVALNAEAGPVLDDATLRAVVRVANAHGTPVTAHVQGAGQTLRAQRAGVNVLAHTPWMEDLDDDLINRLAHTTTIISTIDIHGWGAHTPEQETALGNLRRFHAAGGAVRYGTDLGNGPLPEAINAREIVALTEAGLSPAHILRALTSQSLAIGQPADLIRVPADPLRSLETLAQAAPICKGGQRR